MINEMEQKSLVEMIPEMVQEIQCHKCYLDNNNEALEIYEGDLLDKILKILKLSLSPDYYSKIEHRVIPINFMPRIIDKMAQVYAKEPKRTCDNQDFINDYENFLDINAEMNTADEYANLFKGYALEPYVNEEGKPSLRPIPYDQFLVMSTSHVNKTKMTIFIKFMGTYEKECVIKDETTGNETVEYMDVDYFIAYTNDEIVAFDMQNDHMPELTSEIEGENPIGIIPFVYGNRSKNRLIPLQDSDLVQMIKMFPVLFTDLGGAVMFQCFSILYGVDVDTDGLKMSPNAFWDFKSDASKDNAKPEVGVIKPEADVDKVLNYISNMFNSWAESKSIRVNKISSENTQTFASGISKAIDEMDTFMVRKKNIPFFRKEEKELWYLLALMNNYWIESDQIDTDLYEVSPVDPAVIKKTFAIEFEPPMPLENRSEVVGTQKVEVDNGFTTRRRAIAKINPELGDTEIDELMKEIDIENVDTDDNEENLNEEESQDKDNPENLEE